MEKTHCNHQEKKKADMGNLARGGGIGAFLLYGGAMATAAFAIDFLVKKKGRFINLSPGNGLIPPPAIDSETTVRTPSCLDDDDTCASKETDGVNCRNPPACDSEKFSSSISPPKVAADHDSFIIVEDDFHLFPIQLKAEIGEVECEKAIILDGLGFNKGMLAELQSPIAKMDFFFKETSTISWNAEEEEAVESDENTKCTDQIKDQDSRVENEGKIPLFQEHGCGCVDEEHINDDPMQENQPTLDASHEEETNVVHQNDQEHGCGCGDEQDMNQPMQENKPTLDASHQNNLQGKIEEYSVDLDCFWSAKNQLVNFISEQVGNGRSRMIVATIPILSSFLCSWFFGLSFQQLCFIVLSSLILSQFRIIN